MADDIGDEVQLLEIIGHPQRLQVKRPDPRAGRQCRLHAIGFLAMGMGPTAELTLKQAVQGKCESLCSLNSSVIVDLLGTSPQEFIHAARLPSHKYAVRRELTKRHEYNSLKESFDVSLENSWKLIGYVHVTSLCRQRWVTKHLQLSAVTPLGVLLPFGAMTTPV